MKTKKFIAKNASIVKFGAAVIVSSVVSLVASAYLDQVLKAINCTANHIVDRLISDSSK